MSDIELDIPWWFVPATIYLLPAIIVLAVTGLSDRYDVNTPAWLTVCAVMFSTTVWAGGAWLIFA